MEFIDISRSIFGAEVYPGDPEPEFRFISKIGPSADCNLSEISMCPHTATHIDAPLHFLENGSPVEEYPPDVFIGPCTVIEVRPGVITGEDAEDMVPEGCERLLIKGNSRAFFMDASAEIFAESGLKLIGTDALSVGCHGNQIKPHKAFLMNNVCILEGLDLSSVRPGNYFLFAAPIKLNGLEGAPARAYLVEDYIFWSGKN